MKTLVMAVVGLAIAVSANAATAYVVEVTTTVPMASVATARDTAELGAVVRAAIQDVLDHAIAFTPSVVRLEDATIIGDRLYIRLLVADEEGQSALDALPKDHEREPAPDDEADPGPSAGVTL